MFSAAITQHFTCSLLAVKVEAGGMLNMHRFFAEQRPAIFSAFALLCLVGVLADDIQRNSARPSPHASQEICSLFVLDAPRPRPHTHSMSQALTPAASSAAPPNPAAPFRRAINALLETGRDLLARIARARAPDPANPVGLDPRQLPALPRALSRNLARAERRVETATLWVLALARTLAGDRSFLPRARLLGLGCWQVRPPRIALPRPPTEHQREQARLRYLRRTLATIPTATIARRLAARLHIRAHDDAWPEALLQIPEPPAVWAARAHRPAPQAGPEPHAISHATSHAPSPQAEPDGFPRAPAIPFHPRQ